jgi:hypothetical protein
MIFVNGLPVAPRPPLRRCVTNEKAAGDDAAATFPKLPSVEAGNKVEETQCEK